MFNTKCQDRADTLDPRPLRDYELTKIHGRKGGLSNARADKLEKWRSSECDQARRGHAYAPGVA